VENTSVGLNPKDKVKILDGEYRDCVGTIVNRTAPGIDEWLVKIYGQPRKQTLLRGQHLQKIGKKVRNGGS
jgi:hypothetical protein